MAVRESPSWLQNGSHSAENDRLLLQSLLGGSPNQALTSGIVAAVDLAVTQNGTPNMSVNVAAGACFIPGTESSMQGVYNLVNDASVNVAISTANATNPRIDLIIAEILDDEYSGSSHIGQIIVVTGTPAASPSVPATPKNSLVLAHIAVGASVTSIVTANITDERTVFGGTTVRGPQTASVATSQTTTSTAFTDLATPGPAVSVVTGKSAIVVIGASMSNNTSNDGCYMSVAVSGASSLAAGTGGQLASPVLTDPAGTTVQMATLIAFAGDLTPGLNTFTCKYATSIGGIGTFATRNIAVIPLP